MADNEDKTGRQNFRVVGGSDAAGQPPGEGGTDGKGAANQSNGPAGSANGGRGSDGSNGGDGQVPPAGIPRPPKALNKDGQACWDKHIPELQRRGQWSSLFAHEFFRYCEAFQEYCQASRKIKSPKDMVQVSPNGYPQQSAWFTIKSRLGHTMRGLAYDLGLNLKSQAQVESAQLNLFDAAPQEDEQKTGTDSNPFNRF